VVNGSRSRREAGASAGPHLRALRQERDALLAEVRTVRAEVDALRATLERAIQRVPALVVATRGSRHLLELVNPAAARFFRGRALIGVPAVDAFPELRGQSFFELLDRVFQTGRPFVGEGLGAYLPLGGTRPEEAFFDVLCAPRLSAEGKPDGVLVLAVDVSEQVESRQRLEKLATESRTLLAQARQSARVRDQFLALASHELRTPLAALRIDFDTLFRALRREAPHVTGVTGTKLARVDAQLERLDCLVQHLLDVSRIEAGALELELSDFDLVALVDECIGRQQPAARARIEVNHHDTVFGRWDRRRIAHAFTNLLDNAIQHGVGPVDVRIESATDEVTVCVRDHGPGISSEAQDRIFRRFERAEALQPHGGLGLGLWVARQIAESHGGRISLESEPGQGATFTLHLPRMAA
jgi:signal transduction histidine kinase